MAAVPRKPRNCWAPMAAASWPRNQRQWLLRRWLMRVPANQRQWLLKVPSLTSWHLNLCHWSRCCYGHCDTYAVCAVMKAGSAPALPIPLALAAPLAPSGAAMVVAAPLAPSWAAVVAVVAAAVAPMAAGEEVAI